MIFIDDLQTILYYIRINIDILSKHSVNSINTIRKNYFCLLTSSTSRYIQIPQYVIILQCLPGIGAFELARVHLDQTSDVYASAALGLPWPAAAYESSRIFAQIEKLAFVEGDGYVYAMYDHCLVLEKELDSQLELGGEYENLEVGEGVAVFDEVFLAVVNWELCLEVGEEEVFWVFGAWLTIEDYWVEFEPSFRVYLFVS